MIQDLGLILDFNNNKNFSMFILIEWQSLASKTL